MSTAPSPCLECGACCAHFRCSFHWSETDLFPGGLTPADLTTPVSPFLVAMKGTLVKSSKCVALEGDVGKSVRCGIYSERPSPCREFAIDGEGGVGNHRCTEARLAWGLPPVNPPADVPGGGESAPSDPRNPPIAA